MGFLENLSELGGETLGEGKLIVGVDSGPLKKGLDEVSTTVKEKSSGWGSAFKAAQIGVVALATAFIGFAIEGTKKADELEAAIGRIGANAGFSAAQSQKLRTGLLDMSERTVQGVDELAKAIESVAKAGYNVDDSLRIQEASAKAATVTHGELGTVTNTVVTAMKAWGIAASDVGKVTDTLVTTVGRSRIDWDALSRIIATAAPIARDAGVSFEDLNAAIIAVGRSGIPARRAASGVIALMRSLSSSTAQKEMKLLGITVNATTIKHDGLLATLQKIDAASGHHIAVLVHTKGVHVDLTKATERLNVAELKLHELQQKRGVSASSMVAAENRVADARRAIVALQAKEKAAGIDYAKSAAATEKANKGQLQAMQAMVGGASGLVTADILLANGAKDYKEGQDALNNSLGQTNEQFEKIKEADLSVQLALIRNQITRFAIDLGYTLLPYVAKLLAWLTDAVPKGLRAIGDLWNNTLKAPLTAMIQSFLNFAKALKDALFGSGDAGSTATSFFKGFASLIVDILRDVGGIFDIFTKILQLPFVKSFGWIAGLGVVLRVAASLLPAVAKALTGKALGFLNFLTGGIFKIGKGGPANAGLTGPLNEAAAKQSEAAAKTGEAAGKTAESAAKLAESSTESATKLGESAAKLSEAAIKISEGGEKSLLGGELGAVGGGEGFNAAEAIRQNTYTELGIKQGEIAVEQEKAAKMSESASKASAKASDAIVTTTDQQQVAMQQGKVVNEAQLAAADAQKASADAVAQAVKESQTTQADAVKTGQEAQVAIARESAGLRTEFAAGEAAVAGGGGRIKGALGAAGGLIGNVVGKAVVPILLAQLAGDIVKAPLGDFVTHALGKANVGARLKEDFFGGLVDLARTYLFANGNDAWVGKAEDTNIGSLKIKTLELAKLGVTSAEVETAQSKDPLVSLPGQLSLATGKLNERKQHTGETATQWYDRIRGTLDDATVKAIEALRPTNVGDISPSTQKANEAAFQKAIVPILQTALTNQYYTAINSIHTGFSSALGGILEQRGFTAGSASQLSNEDSALIATLATAGADKYGFLLDFVTQKALGQIGDKLTPPTTNTDFGLGPELVSGFDPTVPLAKAAEVLRGNVAEAQRQFAEAMDALPNGQGDAIRKAMKAFAAQTGNIDPAIGQLLAKRFGAHWQEAFKDGTEKFAAEPDKKMRARLAAVLGRDWRATLLSIGEGTASKATIATVSAKMKAAFGANWKTVFANAVSGTTDDATVKEMVRLFGPHWREALGQFGTLLWQSEGGKDHDVLIANFKAYAAKMVEGLSTTDLMPPPPKPSKPRAGARRPGDPEPVKFTAAQDKAARDAVNAAVAKSIKDGTLEATQSPDVVASQAAIVKLGQDWTKSIPDAAARNAFITQMVEWQKTNNSSLNSNMFDVLPTLPSHLNDLTEALGKFDGEVRMALHILGAPITGQRGGTGGPGGHAPAPTHSSTSTGGTGGHGARATATGGIFDVDSVAHAHAGNQGLTIGEAGDEQVAVLSHPKSIGWADIMGSGMGSGSARLPGMKSRGPEAGGGRHQTLYVDHMHVQSAADEQAILDTLEFMAPGGLA